MKRICVVCNRYPGALAPSRHVFVQKLVNAWADIGIDVTVIAPVPVNQYLETFRCQPVEVIERTPTGATVRVLFPRYVTAGQRSLLGFATSRITVRLFHRTVQRAIRRYNVQMDAIYGHFIVPAGITAARIGREVGVPSFAAYGEATPRDLKLYGLRRLSAETRSLSGVVSVSSHNRDILLELGIVRPDRVKVFPNAIQKDRFYPRDKAAARKKFGFDLERFQVVFVGQFNQRKGVLRVAEALDGLDGVEVAFAGQGPLEPRMSNQVFSGVVAPSEIPDFLSAGDVFVMPTLNEGCSNAIVEALACGLPVVSSSRPFNADILDDENAFLIEPMDVAAIRRSVVSLRDAPDLRAKMGAASLRRASHLTIQARAQGILDWMREQS